MGVFRVILLPETLKEQRQMNELLNLLKPLEPWLRGIVSDEMRRTIKTVQDEAQPERHYTREQVCEVAHISAPTLWAWEKQGKITPVRVGRRVLFSESEVQKLLNGNNNVSKFRK